MLNLLRETCFPQFPSPQTLFRIMLHHTAGTLFGGVGTFFIQGFVKNDELLMFVLFCCLMTD